LGYESATAILRGHHFNCLFDVKPLCRDAPRMLRALHRMM
jgi:hypothetical protein